MKNCFYRITAIVMCFALFYQGVYAAGDKDISDEIVKHIPDKGAVPGRYAYYVDNNEGMSGDAFYNNCYYKTETENKKVNIDKYSADGKKVFSVEYKHKYAKTKRDKFGSFLQHCNTTLDFTENGDIYAFTSGYKLFTIFGIATGYWWPIKTKLSKIDSDGKIIFEKEFKETDIRLIKGSTVNSDGNYVAVGQYYKKTFTKQTDMSSKYVGYAFYEFSPDGEIIKKVDIQGDILLSTSHLIYIENKGYMFNYQTKGDFEHYVASFDENFKQIDSVKVFGIFDKADYNSLEAFPVLTGDKDNTEYTVSYLGFDLKEVKRMTIPAPNDKLTVSDFVNLPDGTHIIELETSIENNSQFWLYDENYKPIKKLDMNGYFILSFIQDDGKTITANWYMFKKEGSIGESYRDVVYSCFDEDFNLLWRKSVDETVGTDLSKNK